MSQIDKPTGVFIDWNKLKKESVRIDKDGRETTEINNIEDRPKDLNELIKKRAQRGS